ncbi:flagellar biosynthetic protein FliO [Aeribacillus sp. FSL K6-1305]|uniref:flagellar biosynthetic protein FliO n=1 Tax=Aeribacillus sp. FSL K6-1305 TaxID=2954569 RepID=UPI0030FDB74C
MKRRITYLCCLWLLFFYVPINADFVHAAVKNPTVEEYLKQQTSDQQDEKKEEKATNELVEDGGNSTSLSVFDALKMIFTLILVLGLLIFLLKFLNKKMKLPQETKYLQNLGGISLGQNKSIQLVKVGNRILIVGVGDTIELLQEINDEEEYKKIIDMQKEPGNNAFEQNMMRFILNNHKQKGSEKTSFKKELESLLKERREQMQRLRQKGSKK